MDFLLSTTPRLQFLFMILLYFIDILLSSNILQVTFVLFFIIIFYNNSVFLSYMIFSLLLLMFFIFILFLS